MGSKTASVTSGQVSRGKAIKLTAEMLKLCEAMPNQGEQHQKRAIPPEMDEILRTYWHTKQHQAVVKLCKARFGMGYAVVQRRLKELGVTKERVR